MKVTSKAIISLLLTMIMLTSCNSFLPAIAAATSTATPAPSVTPLPTFSPLPPTETPTPIKTSIPISGTPTVSVIENGLIWSECIVPYFNHPHETADFKFATACLNIDWLGWDDYGMEVNGQRIHEERFDGDGTHGANLRLVIAKDVYETKYTNIDGWNNYELLKNGQAIAKATACPYCTIGDPNLKLWNIGGKSVWEVFTEPPAIFVDGINLNEKNNLEGSYKPYDIKHKLIYVAKMNGKYYVIYDEKVIGHEFDQIFMMYCCASTSVLYGHEQYWFWGVREGTYYVVAIH